MKNEHRTRYKKKTVLQVLPSLISGGVEYEAIDVANYLSNSGFNSFVISNGGNMVKLLSKNVSHINLNLSTKNPIKIIINGIIISYIIKKYYIDILHVRSRAPAWSCLIAKFIIKVTIISTIHGAYNCQNLFKKFYNSVMMKSEKIIATSKFIKSYILENYSVNKNKIIVINRGIETEKFSVNKISIDKINKFKKKYSIPEKTAIILLPARMTKLKGHITLIKALTKIDKNFYCLMVGDTKKHISYTNDVLKQIEVADLCEKVKIFDNEDDIVPLYAISDIILSISNKPEAFGRTIIEAQSMEKLVIATNIGAAMDNIKDKVNGYHVSPENPEELAKILNHSISILGTNEHKIIIKNARENVLKHFKLSYMLEQTLNIYTAYTSKVEF